LRSVQRNSSRDLISEIFNTKKGWWNGSSCRALASKDEDLNSNPRREKKKKEVHLELGAGGSCL
jgi:hypothetical protein